MNQLVKLFVIALFTTTICNAYSQIININPDTTDIPWIAGDAYATPPEIQALIPNMELTSQSAATIINYKADNSKYKYMPPVFHQGGAALCVQVAEIWYTFGYELNRLNNDSAGQKVGDTCYMDNQYHPNFTYNFLNYGTADSGTQFKSGFNIAMEDGIPSWDIYNDEAIDDPSTRYIYWMHGNDKYYKGMKTRVDSIKNITWNDTYESLDLMKHWLNDHNNGDSTGGLAVIGVKPAWWQISMFYPGTPEDTMYYVSQWGEGGSHALTIVGYNDSVQCFQINGDNKYSNEDFDNDGIIELSECELGAFKAVNSYGKEWYGSGYIYIPYKLMDEGLSTPDKAHVCYVSNHNPELIIKTNIEHTCREKIMYMIGYASNANCDNPQMSSSYKIFNRQGGCNSMRGSYNGSIEAAVNFDKFIDKDFGKIFLYIREFADDSSQYEGTTKWWSIVDYRWDKVFELFYPDSNITLLNNISNKYYINYDLIVPGNNQQITNNDTLFSDMVSRFNPTVGNNSTLLVLNGVNIDMYNSNLIISEGSTLTLEDSVTIIAKRDTCRIIIDGNINLGKHINFMADDSALLEIKLNNENLQTTFDSCYFENCKILNYGSEINIENSTFNNCQRIQSSFGKSLIINCNLTNTGIYILNPDEYDFLTTISNNNLLTNNTGTLCGIWMQHCDRFFLTNNYIEGYFTGIDLRYSGEGQTGNQSVLENTIYNCSFNGISTYDTKVSIAGNDIQNNLRGISIWNNSNTAILGDPGALTFEEAQQISNNSSYELYSSVGSFPWYIRNNVIHDTDNAGNPGDPIIYCEPDPSLLIPDTFDIRYNCWDDNFNSITDLYPPYPLYKVNPTTCPGKKSGITQNPELLYFTGLDQFDSAQYTQAQTTFFQVIEEHSHTTYARSALKNLLDIEKFVNNDYSLLQNYYLNNSSILSDSTLHRIAIFLANQCNIEMKQWQDAIDYYESIIVDPLTTDDSIFAIIDLGQLYILMDNYSGRDIAMGMMTEYIPKSEKDLEVRSNKLLKLLPKVKPHNGNDNEASNALIKENRLLQSKPNPSNRIVEIAFILERNSTATIDIINNIGIKIKRLSITGDKGINTVTLNIDDLSSGIYFYALEIENKVVDVKKMIVVR